MDKHSRVWTGSRTLDVDGNIVRMIFKRIIKEFKRIKEYFTTAKEYPDQEHNMI